MANVNKVFLVGRLTADPELRNTPGGKAVTELRMAINDQWTTKDGERKEKTTFVDVTVWDRAAENCCQYLKKGRQAHVEGKLALDTWDDKKTGEKRSKLKVEADRVQFLDGPPSSNGPAPQEREPARSTWGGNGNRQPAPVPPTPGPDDDTDDIPFAIEHESCPWGGLD